MRNIYLLSLAYDDWIRFFNKRHHRKVNLANKLIEEILKNTPHARIASMHNDSARYDVIRSYLDELKNHIHPNDIFWFQYNGHGSNLERHIPIDLTDNWDGKGQSPFTGDNELMDRRELFEKIAQLSGLKFIVMDSCYSDVDEGLPADTIYVAAAEQDATAHGDLSSGVIHPTLSRYSVEDIVQNGAYQMWDGLEYEFGERSVVRSNIVSPQFRITEGHDLPRCQFAQDFYQKLTGERGIIMRRFD